MFLLDARGLIAVQNYYKNYAYASVGSELGVVVFVNYTVFQ